MAPTSSSTTATWVAGADSTSGGSAPETASAENVQWPVVKPMRTMPTSMTRPPSVVTMSACSAARREDARSA